MALHPVLARYATAASNAVEFAEAKNACARQSFIIVGPTSCGKSEMAKALVTQLNQSIFADNGNVDRVVVAEYEDVDDFKAYLDSANVLFMDEISSLATPEFYGHLKILIEWMDLKSPTKNQILVAVGYERDYNALVEVDEGFATRFQFSFSVPRPHNTQLALGFTANMQKEYGITVIGDTNKLASYPAFVSVVSESLYRCAKQHGAVVSTFMSNKVAMTITLAELKKAFTFIQSQRP